MYFHFHYLVFPTFSPFFFCSKALKCGTKAQTVSHFPFSLLLFSAGLDIVYLLNRSASTFTFHYHFHFPIFHFQICFSPCASTQSPRTPNRSANTFTFHYHFHFPTFHFQICFSPCASTQSPRTPNRSASTTDVESHTESDAERGEVTLPAFDLFIFTF